MRRTPGVHMWKFARCYSSQLRDTVMLKRWLRSLPHLQRGAGGIARGCGVGHGRVIPSLHRLFSLCADATACSSPARLARPVCCNGSGSGHCHVLPAAGGVGLNRQWPHGIARLHTGPAVLFPYRQHAPDDNQVKRHGGIPSEHFSAEAKSHPSNPSPGDDFSVPAETTNTVKVSRALIRSILPPLLA